METIEITPHVYWAVVVLNLLTVALVAWSRRRSVRDYRARLQCLEDRLEAAHRELVLALPEGFDWPNKLVLFWDVKTGDFQLSRREEAFFRPHVPIEMVAVTIIDAIDKIPTLIEP